MREFDKWISRRQKSFEHLLDMDIRLQAFSLAISTNKRMAAFDHVVRAYQLHHSGNDYFIPCIQPFLMKQKYKEVGPVFYKASRINGMNIGLKSYYLCYIFITFLDHLIHLQNTFQLSNNGY